MMVCHPWTLPARLAQIVRTYYQVKVRGLQSEQRCLTPLHMYIADKHLVRFTEQQQVEPDFTITKLTPGLHSPDTRLMLAKQLSSHSFFIKTYFILLRQDMIHTPGRPQHSRSSSSPQRRLNTPKNKIIIVILSH